MSEPRLPLAGMSAVVSGGGGAIGSATTALLVRDGARVLIGGRTEARLHAAAEPLVDLAASAGGSIDWMVCDGLAEDEVRTLVARAAEPTGRVDIAVNVVGGGRGTAPILRVTTEMLEGTLRQNITSAFLLLKHAGGAMVRAGGGSFVAVSSMQAAQGAPMLASYSAAKAGLEVLMKVAADELGGQGVRINMVRPGLTRTGASTHLSAVDDVVEAYFEQQPIRRAGLPADIAEAIRFLAGPESSWTTGVTLTVDGGTSLRRFPDLAFHWRRTLGEQMEKAARGEVD